MGRGLVQAPGTPFPDYVYLDNRTRCTPLMQRGPPGRCAGNLESRLHDTRYLAQDGMVQSMKGGTRQMPDGHGAVAGAASMLVDLTQQRRTEERLLLAATVFDSTSDGIVITDPHLHIVEVNAAFMNITGYTREQVMGRNPSMFSSGRHDRDFYRTMWHSLQGKGAWSGEIWNRRADGELVAEMLRIRAVHSSRGERTHYVGVFSDLTLQKRQQEKLQRLAHFDPLTGLPNRVLALQRLAQRLTGTERQGSRVAVCYLDLDGFKTVNDALGPVQGDALLVETGQRIRQALRECDTVARLGGDEFLLVLDLHDVAAVQPILRHVLERLAQPFVLNGQSSHVTASAGTALYPDHGVTPEHLVRAAFQAMYRAKRLGKGRVCVAGDGIDRPAAQEALLEELRTALDLDQLVLHYQPKVCTHTRRPLGTEALVRWQHPRRGLLPPGAFLPAVVGTPLEVALDLWVLRTAIAQWVRWHAAGRGLHMAINVSAATLALPDLAGTIAETVCMVAPDQTIPLGGLELEVLETAALSDLDAASRGIEACAAHGISFALDDFGTGYSSLSYLQRLPVTTLKIDRSFVSNMLTHRGNLHIVRAVIGLAQAFGVGTVAEGVETAEQARMLAELGCQQLQGYGIAQPMPVRALEAWLDSCADSDGVSATVHQRPGNDPIGGNP